MKCVLYNQRWSQIVDSEISLTDGTIVARPYRLSDAEAFYEAAQESVAEVSPWLPWCRADYSLADSIAWLASVPNKWERDNNYHFAVTDAKSGGFVGGCSLYDVNRADSFADLAYWIRTSQAQKGFATAAARLVAQFGLTRLGLNRIEIVVAVNNPASLRVAEKTGAKQEGVLRNRLVCGDNVYDAVMFSLIPDDLENHQLSANHQSAMIRTLEELAANAWPPLQTVLYDGWVLRFADGYTRRANSVHPLYASGLDVGRKIETCERFYQDKGLAVVFKMTPAAQPEHLDDLLAARGYAIDARTSVQVLDLNSLDKAPTQTTQLAESLSDEWLDAFCRLGRLNDQRKVIAKRMLSNLLPTCCFASVRHQGQIVACGLGVRQDRYVGLFDVVTDENLRRQGLGKQLVLDILAWAKHGGAQTAYLQVMLNNEPALRLYAGLGFQEVYRYWYRINPNP